ncbi:hypothetical protein [Kitasatospora sp. CB01950]|uniref:hypothetical protein n=1 Tax=Kitasatospora sp. CB01950 TaxID=1703930 RepID=UPI00093AA9FA|nr:hypothetical protein [Kitasatospora sp. CB01950]OKI91901.1 hypothetical protein AMK19_33730 [Kitasatospora sp. CB01950]
MTTDWPTLNDACGSAAHVPALLDSFEADQAGVWSELLDHLCPHLDTAYLAGFAALPRLATLATRTTTEDRPWVLLAAGAIMSCAPTGDAVFENLATPLADLRRLTDQLLPATAAPEDYISLLQALLSFEGVEIWDRCLEGLQTGEYEVECPYCGVNILLALGEDECFASSDDHPLRDAEKTPLRPSAPEQLEGLARRLYNRALADGQQLVAQGLPYLFGCATCPDCGTAFSVADRVSARWR